ncbi:hypothetical protein BHE74_00002156 [Ensete ventricosum]|nr:hypothetical protein GW17_00007513 [Ensete ventricosum]RWW88946.1 hypothetical protein BHE74_00002156 [Ensete ventricosum]
MGSGGFCFMASLEPWDSCLYTCFPSASAYSFIELKFGATFGGSCKWSGAVVLVSFRVEYPKDYEELSEEDHKDFKHTRYGKKNLFFKALFFVLV